MKVLNSKNIYIDVFCFLLQRKRIVIISSHKGTSGNIHNTLSDGEEINKWKQLLLIIIIIVTSSLPPQ